MVKEIVMDRLNKSDIKFQFSKGELGDIMDKSMDEYHCWLQLKKSEQIVDTLVSPKSFIPTKKYQVLVNP
jgi:negative regulator of genetic competence, sporulation and motility